MLGILNRYYAEMDIYCALDFKFEKARVRDETIYEILNPWCVYV